MYPEQIDIVDVFMCWERGQVNIGFFSYIVVCGGINDDVYFFGRVAVFFGVLI